MPGLKGVTTLNLLSQVFTLVRLEAQFYARDHKLVLAAIAVVFIPAVYVVIYLSSVWDPAANTGQLPVGLVNLDQSVEYRKHVFNVGQEVTSKLKAANTFGYIDYTDEQEARRLVRRGDLAFALIIPHNFSSNAIPGAKAGGGRLEVYTSEGNSYQGAGLARRFAGELVHEVNKSLNERRWALVLATTAGSQRSVDRLRDGVNQLRAGAKELTLGTTHTDAGSELVSAGLGRLNETLVQLTGGVKELRAGLQVMDARRPSNLELNRLRSGAETLAAGHGDLGRGLSELQTGTRRLQDGVSSFRDEANASIFVGARVVEGLDQLVAGVSQLDIGLKSAAGAQQKLADGADRLSAGVGALTDGTRTMGAGIHTAVTKLPEDRQMDELAYSVGKLAAGSAALADGSKKVRAGAHHLASGVDLLAASLPVSVQAMDGSAEGLADSVRPSVRVDAPVQNNGSGLAPNIIPAALWLGAGIAAFLIHVRVLPSRVKLFASPAQVLGKILIPAAVVLLQSLLVMITLIFHLKVQIINPGALATTLCIASMTFLVIVFALTRAFGDPGKALALLFLAVQLSSSGGILPVELSGRLFVDISPWLPLTWVVRAIKASMFGAYDGAWQFPLLLVTLAGAAAATMACTVGRWRYVEQSLIRPAVDF
jgi:putative membrane protein